MHIENTDNERVEVALFRYKWKLMENKEYALPGLTIFILEVWALIIHY